MNKKIITITLSVLVFVMVIGYATFSTNLKINGTANIASTWKVVFTKIEEVSKTSGVTITSSPTASGTSATFNVDFKSPGDKIVYRITIENKGTLNAIIQNIASSELGSDAIKFEIDGIKKGDKLAGGATTTFNITISYDNSVTSQPNLTDNKLTLDVTYVQDLGQSITETTPSIIPIRLSRKILQDNTPHSDEGINFGAISSDSNGKGLYYTNKNTDDGKTTYYFRGAVDNNYVYFAGYYWQIIRINEDGSIRLIYQGTSPTATGEFAQIGISAFNSNVGDNTYVGYMHTGPTTYQDGYGIRSSSSAYWTRVSTLTTIKMATSYTFNSSTGVYTLTSPVDGKYTSTYYNYYTCASTTGVTCKLMVKLTSAREKDGYNELVGGEFHAGYFTTDYEQAHKNEVNSDIKIMVDNWYKNNLTSYNSLIADSGFCNDRSLYSGTGIGRITSYYGAAGRNYNHKTPQFSCPNEARDLFTTATSSKGNRSLTYPVGLITADEAAYAGGVYAINNSNYYLYTGTHYWTMSPFSFVASNVRAGELGVNSNGYLSHHSSVVIGLGVRPVINLKSNVEITSGDGTSSSPYVIKTN